MISDSISFEARLRSQTYCRWKPGILMAPLSMKLVMVRTLKSFGRRRELVLVDLPVLVVDIRAEVDAELRSGFCRVNLFFSFEFRHSQLQVLLSTGVFGRRHLAVDDTSPWITTQ